MNNLRPFILAALLCLSLSIQPALAQKRVRDLKPTVILVSLDGFRADYLEKFAPPTLNRLAREGVRAEWMIPSFPSKTFPNHYTIATGLYPEHHGIIENNIWDFNTTFGLSKREEVQNGRWWLGEPIWVTAEKQGVHSAAFFFPGTEAEIMGRRPSIWKDYDGKIPNDERVAAVLGWLDKPAAERPRMITLYFSDVDDAGHATSPDSAATRAAVLKVDSNIKQLVDGLRSRKIDKKVNLIVVSDHGMAPVNPRNAVVLDDYFNVEMADRILWTGEIVQIFPRSGREDEIMNKLAGVTHATCWRKADIPARFHYRESPRIAPIVCSSQVGWVMTDRKRLESQQKRADFGAMKGAHGYDNLAPEMRALFIAHGKAFRRHEVIGPFANVEIYNVMCKILGLRPAPNDGNFANVKAMMR